MLGAVRVRTGDGDPVVVPEGKVRAVLAALLAHHGTPVSADRLIDDVWGEDAPGNPVNTLQTKVSQLRRALDRAEPGARGLVAYLPAGYLLQVEDDAVDAARFSALVARARKEPEPGVRVALLTDALALWRGPAYADFRDAGFTRAAVTRLEEQRLTAVEDLAELRLDLGEHGLVADELADLVAAHPLRERLRAAQMRALYRAGRQAEALAAYQDLRVRLGDELGLDPGDAVTALHQAILVRDPELAPPAAPVASAARPTTNLPAHLDAPIGRDAAIARVCGLLDASRLVTLVGPGGVGKTRLALAAAAARTGHNDNHAGNQVDNHAANSRRDVPDTFPDGVWLVELAALAPGKDALAPAVAAALGLRDDATRGSALDGLAELLRDRRLLLLLDNCEHVVDEAAELAARLLRDAAGVRLLATSQEPLAVAGEVVEAVVPLDESDAVRLFADRAAASSPGFTLDDTRSATVAAICRRLDRLPLAIELAAARVRALGLDELAVRLDDRFRVLAAGRRDAPSRQRTLRAMIDWSWDPLTAPERAVLRRLSVFWNGCSLESAEDVCADAATRAGAPGTTPAVRRSEVVDIVSRLVDRSLLTVVAGAAGTRYRLLESVAAYGRERLDEAGETAEFTTRHRAHFVARAERAAPHLHTRDQRAWLTQLDDDAADLRAALDDAVAVGTGEALAVALRLVNALSWYWMLRGRLTEARRALDAVLDAVLNAVPGAVPGSVPDAVPDTAPAAAPTATPDAAPTAPATAQALADATARRAAFALMTGDGAYADATAPPGATPRAAWFLAFARVGFGETADVAAELTPVLEAFRAEGDTWGLAAALGTRASKAIYDGDLAALRAYAVDSAALFAEVGDRWGHLRATEQLGILAEIAGDYAEAARLHRDALRVAEELQLWVEASFRLARLGRIALLTGELDQADDFHGRAVRLAEEQSHKPAEQFAATGLAIGARRRGDHTRAEELLRPWVAWNRRLGVAAGEALVLALLGLVAEERGDAAAATSLHLEGYAAAARTGDPRAVAFALEGLAGARSLAGDHERAAALLGTAEALRDSVGSPLPDAERGDVDRAAARARDGLGAATYAKAVDAGRTMLPDEHVAALAHDRIPENPAAR